MEAARSRRKTTEAANRAAPRGSRYPPPVPRLYRRRDVRAGVIKADSRWEESEKVEDRLRRSCSARRRGAGRRRWGAHPIEPPNAMTNASDRRTRSRCVIPRTRRRRVWRRTAGTCTREASSDGRESSAHTPPRVTQLASPPVGMGGEESVAFRGMTNVSRALMEDRAHEDFLQRQSSALKKRDAKMEETRRVKEAEALKKEEARCGPRR